MAVLYNTGARALAEGTLLTGPIKLAFLVGTDLPDDAQDSQLSKLADLLAVTDVDEAVGGGYARADVTGINVETSGGAIVTHTQVSFGSVSCGHVCGLVYYIDDADDTLVSIHEADFTTSGSLVTISGDSWIAVNARALPFQKGATLTGDGTLSSPLEVTFPSRQLITTAWDTDDPVATLDTDVIVITAGTVTGGSTRTLVVTEPVAGDPYQLVVVNANDYRLVIDPDAATIDDASTITVLPGSVTMLWYDGDGAWHSDNERRIEPLTYALSSETQDLSTGAAKLTVRMPFAMQLTDLPRASLTTASSSGPVTVDINEGGVSILSTKLSIDANERTSVTAATPAVLSDTLLADDAEVVFDVDTAGTGAVGLKVTLIGMRV